MKKLLITSLLLISLVSHLQAQTDNFKTAKEIGKTAAQHLKNNNFEMLHQLFGGEMATQLTAKRMEKSFVGLFKQYGEITAIQEFNLKNTAEAPYYRQAIEFEKGKFFLVFALNKENEITNFNLRPYQPTFEWTVPSYAKGKHQFLQQDITIGDSLPLMGKMTIPDYAVETIVVFAHGSGPNDMDESLGPNKIFKDLAFGLAAKGISSIRYNKRTYDYPSTMARVGNSVTVNNLVVDDAVKAIELAKQKGAKNVIFLGHSLSGYLAPLIASRVELDGVIVFAGNSSPLEDLLVGQYEHIRKNDTSNQINDFQMAMITTQVERIQKNDYDSTTASPLLPLGLPASFWLSLKEYSPVKMAKKQVQPYLILNGERDYQVDTKQAKAWKNGNKNKLSKTIIYPKLNHLFISGEGICIPSEYEKEGHVEEQVLTDIINWIKTL